MGMLLCTTRSFTRIRHRQKIRIRMLHFRKALRRQYDLPQTLFIELIGRSPRCPPAKRRPHRDVVILLGDVLMNRIVRETSQRKMAAREKYFNLVRSRKLADASEYVGGLVVS